MRRCETGVIAGAPPRSWVRDRSAGDGARAAGRRGRVTRRRPGAVAARAPGGPARSAPRHHPRVHRRRPQAPGAAPVGRRTVGYATPRRGRPRLGPHRRRGHPAHLDGGRSVLDACHNGARALRVDRPGAAGPCARDPPGTARDACRGSRWRVPIGRRGRPRRWRVGGAGVVRGGDRCCDPAVCPPARRRAAARPGSGAAGAAGGPRGSADCRGDNAEDGPPHPAGSRATGGRVGRVIFRWRSVLPI